MNWSALCVGIATGLLVAHAAAAQETCRCAGVAFTWAGCAADGHCDPGAWTGCAPSPDDDFVVGAGCSALVDGDDVLLTQTGSRRISVEAGGSFVMRGPAELRLGEVGLASAPGARVELSGCFRRFGSAGEECAATLGPAALFPIGRVEPCRGGDCSADAHAVRIDWRNADEPLAASVDALLARIEPGRDALCFWQLSEAGAVGSDSGYCYAILAVGTGAGERFLDFDVRQTWSAQSDQAGYPLSRRSVQVATLAAAAPLGTRSLAFTETGLADGLANPVGRFLRCTDDSPPQLVAGADDDPAGDRVRLADPKGLASPLPAGSKCTLDWGWNDWDVAFVMAPVHVTSATPATGHTQLELGGATALRGVVIDGLGGNGTYGSGSVVRIRNGPLEALEHVWVVDPLAMDTAAVLLDDLPCGTSIRHLVVTGGPPEPEHDQNYGLAWFGGAGCAYRVEHLYTRFLGDDSFVLESSGADPVGSISLRWVQAGPGSIPGDSGQLFDFGWPNHSAVSVRDALCTGCTSADGFGSLVAPSSGPGLVEDFLWIGVRNGGLQTANIESDNPSFGFRRFGVIGSMVDANQPLGLGPLAGLQASDFYVRDVSDPRPASSQLCMGAPYSAQTRSLARGVFLDVSLGSTPCEIGASTALEDVYFVDVTRAYGDPGALVQIEPWTSLAVLSRLTFAWTKPATGIVFAVSNPWSQAASGLALDGLLVAGLQGPDAQQAMVLGSAASAASAAWGAPSCFDDVVAVDTPSTLAGYGVAPVVGVDPHFVDPAADRFDLAPSSPLAGVGCGARAAGVAQTSWAHVKAKLAPTYLGEAPRACGLGVEIAVALAGIGAHLSRGSRAASRRGSGCPSDGRGAAGRPRAPTSRRD